MTKSRGLRYRRTQSDLEKEKQTGLRFCEKCKISKPFVDFYKMRGTNFLHGKCKSCLLGIQSAKDGHVNVIPLDTKKICTRCATEKLVIDFNKTRNRYRPECRDCQQIAAKIYHEKAREKKKIYHAQRHRENPEHAWKKSLKRYFGITVEDFNLMLDFQQGRCKCCGIPQHELKKKLCVDHCHRTGEIRGLLCHNCNATLGFTGDNINTLKNMIKYLEDFNERS